MTEIEIERDAWHFWFDEIGHFLGPAAGLTKERVDKTIRDLESMDPTGFALMAKTKPVEFRSHHARALPIYIAVGNLIREKVL